jgi:hypothetical protein
MEKSQAPRSRLFSGVRTEKLAMEVLGLRDEIFKDLYK